MLTEINSCQWANAAHTQITLLGTHPEFGEIPFTADSNDSEAHGRDLFARAVAGEFGAVAEYVAPVKTAGQLRAEAKVARTAAVAAITVTTSTGKVFDGDERSQERMTRAVMISQLTGLTSTTWTLADNSIATVTLAEMVEALALAGQAQAALWPIA